MKITQYATKAAYYDGPFGNGHPWISAGMGYVLLSDSGAKIAIDGGHPADADGFLDEICKNSFSHVDAWVLTHPHVDHMSVLFELSRRADIAKKLTVGRIICAFPENFSTDSGEDIKNEIAAVNAAADALGAKLTAANDGDVIDAGDMKIEIHFSPMGREWINGKNMLSLIFSVTDSRGKRAMFTGDAGRISLADTASRLAGKLKSDTLQLPHHALCDTGDESFYREVGAATVFAPISVAGERDMASGNYGDATAANDLAKAMATRVIKAFDGTETVEI